MPAFNFLTESTETRLKLVLDMMRMIARVPDIKVDLACFYRPDTECGTVACLVGWAALDPELSKTLDIEMPPVPDTDPADGCDFRVLQRPGFENQILEVYDVVKPNWLSNELFTSFGTRAGRTEKQEALYRLWVLARSIQYSEWNLHRADARQIWRMEYHSQESVDQFQGWEAQCIRNVGNDRHWERVLEAMMYTVNSRRGIESKLYYEAHITIEPVFDERLAEASALARQFKFKVADLLMKKREQDTEERSANDTFMTAHGKHLGEITERVKVAVETLKANGFKVWRYKVEDTVFDSRTADILNLLEPHNG